MALARGVSHGGCSLLRVLRQNKIPKCKEAPSHSQHSLLHPTAQPSQLHSLTGHCQDVAQLSPSKGGNSHLADPQPGPSGWHLATANGDPLRLQNLRLWVAEIPLALLAGLPPRPVHLESLQENLGKFEGT
jgi:hypothetical protein